MKLSTLPLPLGIKSTVQTVLVVFVKLFAWVGLYWLHECSNDSSFNLTLQYTYITIILALIPVLIIVVMCIIIVCVMLKHFCFREYRTFTDEEQSVISVYLRALQEYKCE